MNTRPAALTALAAAVVLVGCGAKTMGSPSASDLSVAASAKLADTVTSCVADAGAAFPGYSNDPGRELAQLGCQRVTCDSLAQYVDTARFASADPRHGQAAADWLHGRWSSVGCLEVQARSEAAG